MDLSEGFVFLLFYNRALFPTPCLQPTSLVLTMGASALNMVSWEGRQDQLENTVSTLHLGKMIFLVKAASPGTVKH